MGTHGAIPLQRADADVCRLHAAADNAFQLLHHSGIVLGIHTALAASQEGTQPHRFSFVDLKIGMPVIQGIQTTYSRTHIVGPETGQNRNLFRESTSGFPPSG